MFYECKCTLERRCYGCREEAKLKAKPLTHKEQYGQCEDAPCCGCCGQDYNEPPDSDDYDYGD